jgi:acyl-CoA synthetase (AMP-forming)/AMP-acid ligase II
MLVNMGRLIGQTALSFSGRPALVNLERNRRFSYGQMHRLSNRMSNLLTGRFGMGSGDFYVTLLENDHVGLFHPWMFKCPAAGVWLDIRESDQEKLAQIDYVKPRLIFIERHFLPRMFGPLIERGFDIISMDPPQENHPKLHYFWDLVEQAPETEVEAEFDFQDTDQHIALLRFTGGTTGRAKCAMYSMANLWAWGMNPAHYIHTMPFSHPKLLLFSPVNHAASGSVVIPMHLKGGTLFTLNRADLGLMGPAIAKEKVEMIYTVPTVLYRILDEGLAQKHDLSSLKTIRYGGAPISPAKLESLLAQFGKVFVQGYGSSECWPSCTILAREDHGTQSQTQIKRLASVGRPFPGQEIIFCDEQGRRLGANQEGELYIRGANTITGYFRSPELTQEHFTENGFWKSGDIGFQDEQGYVFLVDRKKDIIISGGMNVYATEVENCLNSHAAVANSAVVGVPDEDWGEAVQAAVVLRPGASAEPQELIAFCKENLARFKAPKAVEILDELPLSGAGKVLRRKVRRRLMDKKARQNP